MTENEQEAPPAPPRVPNVSPGAMSGLSHEVIGSAANEVHASQYGDPDDDQGHDDPAPFDVTDSADVHDWVLNTRVRVVEYAIAEVEAQDEPDESLLADLRQLLDGGEVPADEDDDEGQSEGDDGDLSTVPEVTIPDDLADTVDAKVSWVHEAETPEELTARANAVLVAEAARDEQRTTLVEPLEALLAKQAAPADAGADDAD